MDKLRTWLNEGRGRVSELASALNITHSAISQWDRVPSDRILQVERITGIARGDLRPDLYGDLPAEKIEAAE